MLKIKNINFKPCVTDGRFNESKYSFFVLQPADSKREEFRKYLEKSGVLDSLTKGESMGQILFQKQQ